MNSLWFIYCSTSISRSWTDVLLCWMLRSSSANVFIYWLCLESDSAWEIQRWSSSINCLLFLYLHISLRRHISLERDVIQTGHVSSLLSCYSNQICAFDYSLQCLFSIPQVDLPWIYSSNEIFSPLYLPMWGRVTPPHHICPLQGSQPLIIISLWKSYNPSAFLPFPFYFH